MAFNWFNLTWIFLWEVSVGLWCFCKYANANSDNWYTGRITIWCNFEYSFSMFVDNNSWTTFLIFKASKSVRYANSGISLYPGAHCIAVKTVLASFDKYS